MKTGVKASGLLCVTSSFIGSCIMNDINKRTKATADEPVVTKPTNLKKRNVLFYYFFFLGGGGGGGGLIKC